MHQEKSAGTPGAYNLPFTECLLCAGRCLLYAHTAARQSPSAVQGWSPSPVVSVSLLPRGPGQLGDAECWRVGRAWEETLSITHEPSGTLFASGGRMGVGMTHAPGQPRLSYRNTSMAETSGGLRPRKPGPEEGLAFHSKPDGGWLRPQRVAMAMVWVADEARAERGQWPHQGCDPNGAQQDRPFGGTLSCRQDACES